MPVGTYTGAIMTISANPGDVLLTVAADPESGFPVAAGDQHPVRSDPDPGQAGQRRQPTRFLWQVNFDSPLTVSSSSSNALDLEFDLAHPAFIVGHTPPAADGATLWAVNFKGPVRPHPVHDITALVLRHTYGTVTQRRRPSRASRSPRISRLYPATILRQQITGTVSLTIDADSANGTIVYDLDAGTRTVVDNFAQRWQHERPVRAHCRTLPGGWHAGRGARVGEQQLQQGMAEPRRPRAERQHQPPTSSA